MESRKRDDLKAQAEAALKQKIAESMNISSAKSSEEAISIYNQLVNCGCLQITSPEEPPLILGALTLDSLSDYRQGASIKPGNIFLDMRNLIDAIPSVIESTICIATDIPILKICAALTIWKSLRDTFSVEITKEQAFVIVALWKNCNAYQTIALKDGYDATNKLLVKHGEMPFSWEKYNPIIDSLEKIRCLELIKDGIWLREWVRKTYIDHC